jgi:1-acyl-sn-glycerol-3-phosphate acyltransferase
LQKNTVVEEEISVPFKPINIKEVFASKNPALARMMPGFVYRFINSVMQIDYINDLLSRHGHLRGVEFIDKVIEEFNVRLYLHGLENIPDSGRFIFASNHPLGGFDGMLLLKAVDEKLGKPRFLINDVLMNIPQLKTLFVPVNKHGSHSRETAKILSETYNSDVQILIFPSGFASRKIKGKITDLEWKKHFISKALQYQRDVIPVFVGGRNSNRFYRVAGLRKFFRIKWNLEMFFLPDETVRHRNTDVHIYFGKPAAYTTFDTSRTHQEWANWVREKAYSLQGKQQSKIIESTETL